VPVQMGKELAFVVDTPGFGDSHRTDAEVLATISDFLAAQYASGFRLSGIIWLHPINEIRMRSRDSLLMFQELCGEDALGNVTLLTTRWDIVEDEGIGARRERELRRDFWKDMIAHGSVVQRFDGTQVTAKAIVRRMLRNPSVVLQIQKDTMGQGMTVAETAAGSRATLDLDARLQQKEDEIKSIEEELALTRRRNDLVSQESLQERHNQEAADAERLQRSRRRLGANLRQEMADKIDQEARRRGLGESDREADTKDPKKKREGDKEKWKSRISIFATVLNLTLSMVINLIQGCDFSM